MSEKPEGVQWVLDRHKYAVAPYGAWMQFAERVEKFWKGDFNIPTDAPGDIEVVRPAKAANIVQKYMSMLAIRATRRISVARRERTKQEEAATERIERCLRAYVDGLDKNGRMHPWRAAAWWAIMRGRGVLLTRYIPDEDGGNIHVIAPDPLEVYPVWDEIGITYYTREYYKTRWELTRYFDGIEENAKRCGLSVPNARAARALSSKPEDPPSPHDIIQVVEYWDDEWYAAVVGGTEFFGPMKHQYGVVPISEARFNETPMYDPRWASISLLGHVLDDLRAYNIMLSKQATGFEQFYYPKMFYVSADGQIMEYSGDAKPGQFVPIMEGTQPIILTPSPNHEAMVLFKNEIESNIAQGTLPQIVYTQDIPRVSGFLVSQVLSLVQDAIADKRVALERMYSDNLSQVLMLMERFGKYRKDGGWSFNVYESKHSGRRVVEVLRPEDIDGHYDVKVSVIASLPQDKIQQVTIFNQIRRRDPVTGEPEMPWEQALEYAGMADDVDDFSELRRQRDLEWALAHDKELQALRLQAVRYENAELIREWEKLAERQAREDERRAERAAEREAEMRGERPLAIPQDKLSPEVLHAMALLLQRGQDARAVLNMDNRTILALAREHMGAQGYGGALPTSPVHAGVQGEMSAPQTSVGFSPSEGDIAELMRALGYGGYVPQEAAGEYQPPGEQPPFGGYETGIPTSVQPPAVAGNLPRRSADSTLEFDQLEEYIRRGALPPPK